MKKLIFFSYLLQLHPLCHNNMARSHSFLIILFQSNSIKNSISCPEWYCTSFCSPCTGIQNGGRGCWFVLLLKWKGKKNEFFSFPFLRTKKIKRTVSRPEIPCFFFVCLFVCCFFLTLTGSNSVTKFGFLTPNSEGWDGWMASKTQWTWVWGNSGRQWKSGQPAVLQFMGLQRVGHDVATEQQLCRSYNSYFLLWLYAKYIPYLLFTLKTPFPL